ncbi:Signal peptidase complex catalytic subunit SEC11 [Aspergillus mulundensis]|uniref:Signal peptidase complex catalytic subunit SEC11 n=1 Tax=Aspergillus mulundensis TaxID=1810919 RepID=A0A3D8SK35_9EURO|nr:Signal peptidase complex catalytic subunit SEC11 [Aspergillus mulundensis]RDW86622.1 Signal peptidase complex catalytic subunit SEC11 [Aspergillus mulundensis]
MRSALNAFLAAAQVVATCFMAWKALCLWTGTPYPIMIVTTESMLPAFAVGDVLLISNHDRSVEVGDLPVCWLPNRAFPMVHRVHRVMYEEEDRRNQDLAQPQQLILTKGDNNLIDDMLLYPDGQDYLTRNEVLGFVRGYIPFIGWIVLVLQEVGRLRELAALLCRGILGTTS